MAGLLGLVAVGMVRLYSERHRWFVRMMGVTIKSVF